MGFGQPFDIVVSLFASNFFLNEHPQLSTEGPRCLVRSPGSEQCQRWGLGGKTLGATPDPAADETDHTPHQLQSSFRFRNPVLISC